MALACVNAPARTGVVLAGFTGYGALWGPYLAALPSIRASAGADVGQLGIALLVGAIVAVPAMVLAGRLLDRFGRKAAVTVLLLFTVAAVLPMIAGSVPSLIATIALFGFSSGACNVVLVALASSVEAGTGARVMNKAHALFSVGVLVCSVATGAAGAAGISPLAVAAVLAAGLIFLVLAFREGLPEPMARDRRPRSRRRLLRPALLLCLLAGLAMMVESGVQQWSAVFLAEAVGAPLALAAIAPGLFAGAMAAGRFGGHWLSIRFSERAVLLAAGAGTAAGVLLIATATAPAAGLAGTALVGAAISVTTPTTYGLVGRDAPADERGAVIGSTASLANLGLLLGPALVGQLAQHTDIRSAIAALTVACLVICLLALRIPVRTTQSAGGSR